MSLIPSYEVEIFPKSFIKHVVCQIRFYSLAEFNDEKTSQFTNKVKDSFVLISTQNTQKIHVDTIQKTLTSTSVPVYQFKSKNNGSLLTLTEETLGLETGNYSDFDSFKNDFQIALNSLNAVYEVGDLNRIGLRYINEHVQKVSELKRPDWTNWISKSLVPEIAFASPKGFAKGFNQQITINEEKGILTHRCGINEVLLAGETIESLTVDLDYFAEMPISFGDTMALISTFNKRLYDAFRWSIGNDFLNAIKGDR